MADAFQTPSSDFLQGPSSESAYLVDMPGQQNSSWVAQVERRRREIENNIRKLEVERKHLDKLLAHLQPVGAEKRRNGSKPGSRSSKFLESAREVLVKTAGGATNFRALYDQVAPAMDPKPSLELARSALIKSGHRFGISYEGADSVKVNTAPTDQSEHVPES